MIPQLDFEKIRKIVEIALDEDIGSGDITTNRTIPSRLECTAVFVVKDDGVIAGMPVVEMILKTFDKRLKVTRLTEEGSMVANGQGIMEVSGSAQSILTTERLSLNFMSHLSGIATLTKKFVDKARPYNVTILDTRKTMPGLRVLEKYAVKVGGGENHRIGLFDQVLIKDNHIAVLRGLGPDYIHKAVELARKDEKERIEIEVENMEEAENAVDAGTDMLLLDNMKVQDMREIVDRYKGRVILEASGGVNLNTIEGIAKTGVDYISIGFLTHSAPSLDISLDIK